MVIIPKRNDKSVFGQWEEFMSLSLTIPDQILDDTISNQKANQCCVFIYTSGTTGMPKGVMLSHDNVGAHDLLRLHSQA